MIRLKRIMLLDLKMIHVIMMDAIRVLEALREKPVTLITNNPKKLEALRAMD